MIPIFIIYTIFFFWLFKDINEVTVLIFILTYILVAKIFSQIYFYIISQRNQERFAMMWHAKEEFEDLKKNFTNNTGSTTAK